MDDQAKNTEYDYDPIAIAKYDLAEILKDKNLGLAEFCGGDRNSRLLRLSVYILRNEIIAMCEKPVE